MRIYSDLLDDPSRNDECFSVCVCVTNGETRKDNASVNMEAFEAAFVPKGLCAIICKVRLRTARDETCQGVVLYRRG